MRFLKQTLAAAALLMLATATAHASLITSPLTGAGVLVQSFDDAAAYDTVPARVQIGTSLGIDLGVTAIGGTLHFGAPFGAWSLGGNGEWTSAKTFVGVDGDWQDANAGIAASIVFDFGGARVAQVGAQINFDPGFTYGGGFPLPLYIAAYDGSGALIEDHFVPLDTPNAIDDGVFFGIASNATNIARFEVSGPYAVADNLSFTTPVPEPETWALMLAGLGLLARRARRGA